MDRKKILITGTAGFIGFHLVNKLLKETGWQIVGLDNINDYYDVNLKYARLKENGIERDKIDEAEKDNSIIPLIQSSINPRYRFIKLDLTDKDKLLALFETEQFDYVVNLAAQAGVRYSLENPQAYLDSNINGFFNILEGCRIYSVKHLVYASSSSVYGGNNNVPFSEDDKTDTPVSLYAATKKSNELLAHTYSHLYSLRSTGLRLFTVYGPWGRPDMAYYSFTEAILNDQEVRLFNHGNLERDFTYIDDVIDGMFGIILNYRKCENYYNIFNIGYHSPVSLLEFVEILENIIGKKSRKNLVEMQTGDVYKTFADICKIQNIFDFSPETNIKVGLERFLAWYKLYHKH